MSGPNQHQRQSFGILLLIGFLLVCGITLFSSLDEAGWIPHARNVDMYMKGDWLQGENRICVGVQSSEAGKPREISALDCPGGIYQAEPHNLKVRFWGKVSRSDSTAAEELSGFKFEWRCTRDSENFSCAAIN